MKITPAAVMALANNETDNFIAATSEGGIEAQEAAGQVSFVASETLPKDCPKEDLEELGFIFSKDADDIFINVKFPDGWKKEATGHSMHNVLIDDKGRKRGRIFYKAAFYDRRASMSLCTRYSSTMDYELDDAVQFLVKAGDEVIYRTEKIECKRGSDEYWSAQDKAEAEVREWLNKNYPYWQEVLEYWG